MNYGGERNLRKMQSEAYKRGVEDARNNEFKPDKYSPALQSAYHTGYQQEASKHVKH